MFVCIPCIFSCSRKVIEPISDKPAIPKLKEKDLVQSLDSLSQLKCESFYSKIGVELTNEKQNVSFKTSLKNIKDSAISAIITYVRFPVFSALASKDSVTLKNISEKCFSKKDLAYFSNIFGVDVTYKNLEELIFGRPIGFDPSLKYYSLNIPNLHALTTQRKKQRKKANSIKNNNLIFTYYFNDFATKLQSIRITSIENSTELQLDYLSYQVIDSFTIPKEIKMTIIKPDSNTKILLKYGKVEIDKKQELIMLIPENYEECN